MFLSCGISHWGRATLSAPAGPGAVRKPPVLCCTRGCADPSSLSPQVHPTGEPGCRHHPALVPAALAAAQDGGCGSGAPDGCQKGGWSCALLCSPDPLTPLSRWPRWWHNSGRFSHQTWAVSVEGALALHPTSPSMIQRAEEGPVPSELCWLCPGISLGWVPAGAEAQGLSTTQLQFPQPPDWEQADTGSSSTSLP